MELDNAEILEEILPSSELLACALSYELGIESGRGLWANYPKSYNDGILCVAQRLRAWLVNPPDGKYSTEA